MRKNCFCIRNILYRPPVHCTFFLSRACRSNAAFHEQMCESSASVRFVALLYGVGCELVVLGNCDSSATKPACNIAKHGTPSRSSGKNHSCPQTPANNIRNNITAVHKRLLHQLVLLLTFTPTSELLLRQEETSQSICRISIPKRSNVWMPFAKLDATLFAEIHILQFHHRYINFVLRRIVWDYAGWPTLPIQCQPYT